MNNENINKKMQFQLNKLCKNCICKNAIGKCPYSNKTGCDDYNLLITKTVLTQYNKADLMTIPASAYANGLIAHKYVGEPIQYSCIDYTYLPLDFFINGLKAYGYSGELRQTKTINI